MRDITENNVIYLFTGGAESECNQSYLIHFVLILIEKDKDVIFSRYGLNSREDLALLPWGGEQSKE